ncbi:MAG TPA: MFS transporter [Rhizomicrobium sp.]|nr:MFS transporter [Rhizomicrobium sp.]
MSAAPLRARNVAAAVAGNALEFYDFVTYAAFALQIGRVFFPAHSAYTSLMLSLATFGTGFAMRPVGGIVIGRMADRVGRRPAMMFALTLMGIGMLVVTVVPSYAAIGLAAPVLVVLARMAQGFALGGQVGSSTAFLLEAAPPERRGLYTAWQAASQFIAILVGSMVGLLVSGFMTPAGVQAYGWRIAFALGVAAFPVGIWLLRGIPETLHTAAGGTSAVDGKSDWDLWLANRRVIVLGLVTLASATIFTYLTNYTTTFAQNALHMNERIAFSAQVVVALCAIPAGLFGGWLSDRVGRWPVMVWPRVAYIVVAWPMYAWIVSSRSPTVLLAAIGVLTVLGAVSFGPFAAALTESLPGRIRGSGFGTIYSSSIALFGGTAQLIATWLNHVTGNPLAFVWYLIASGVVGAVATAMMAETAPARAAEPAESAQPNSVTSRAAAPGGAQGVVTR